jgi:hypothetical protein
MGKIETARAAVLAWSYAVLGLRRRALEDHADAGDSLSTEIDTVFGETGLVMTPAQAPAFFARSSSWRCTACGKVHMFTQLVSVAIASPCSCASIEFEPHREVAFSRDAPPPSQRALAPG